MAVDLELLKAAQELSLQVTKDVKRLKLLKGKVKEMLGKPISYTFDNGVHVSYSFSTSKRFNQNAFKADFPDLFDKYLVESESRALKLS